MRRETAQLVSDAGRALDPPESQLLAKMPLHAITSVHGEAGLRRRLLIEIAQFPPQTGAGSSTRWHWRRGCTRETGGSARRTPITCSGSRSGSSATIRWPTRT